MKSEKAWLGDEFPTQATARDGMVDRREFLTLMSASLALAGLTSCTPSVPEKIVPYVRAPEAIVPGKPLFFATAMPVAGYGLGILAESHMGRPTKIEGNPEHPASMGATDAFAQASVLALYDPDRSQVITSAGRIHTWDDFITLLATELEAKRLNKGEGLRILTETVTSPTLAAQLRRVLELFPAARWHRYEPVNSGTAPVARYHFDKADVILSLDADFLLSMPDHVRNAREFSARRRGNDLSRLYVLESTPSITGAMADHRKATRSSDIHDIASRIASAIDGTSSNDKWFDALARDLQTHPGRSLVLAGPQQPAEVHALAHAMNAKLGNVGQTIEYSGAAEADPVDHIESLGNLSQDMQSGAVDLLLILGGNPVYTAPADLDFAKGLQNVRLRAHLGLYEDETSEMCHWHIPETHYLESWGDIRSYDGTTTIMQPLINPLYAGKSIYEVVSALLGQPTRSSYEIVKENWSRLSDEDWRKAVHDGVVREGNFGMRNSDFGFPSLKSEIRIPHPEIEIVYRPDPTIFDGRFANNAWLQELPKPLTKLTWDNPALLSPATAQRLDVTNHDVIEIKHDGRTVRAPVWISALHADNSITLFLGYGRTRAGRVGSNRGYNAYSIRTSHSPWIAQNVEVHKTGERYSLVSTQEHFSMANRPIALRADQVVAEEEPPTLYPKNPLADSYAWGMSIDISACIGCNACVVACQAENNIPVVGKTQVANSREMHWLRIDTYYDRDTTFFQPMLCQHCENAPCEPVCPVAATTHSNEGLNEMTYNRCVGTRYCSNNCPYKVRRFNFLEYHAEDAASLKLLHNPDVTVRSRGVMEKCTYCVQRINHARIEAKKEDRAIRDGEIVTACQGACPADAIVFGNIHDPESRVAKLKADARNYGVLANLNTRPRTTYLAKVQNPNPELT